MNSTTSRRGRKVRGLLALPLASAMVMALAMPVGATDTGSVAGTVTVAQGGACLLLGASSVDFGTNPFSPPGSMTHARGTFGGTEALEFSLENCADVDETFLARGTDASSQTSAAVWDLQDGNSSLPCLRGPNVYFLISSWSGTNPGSSFLSDVDAALSTVPTPAAGSLNTSLGMRMPCEGSDGAGEVFDLDIIYTAVTE